MARRRAFAALLLLLTTALAGCATSNEDEGTGSASLYVKDKVTDDFSEVHVVFQTATIHRAGGEDEEEDEDEPGDVDDVDDNETNETDDDEAGDDDDGDEGGWMELVANETAGIDVDLLNATGANAAFLGESDLPAGRYTQIRVYVTEAYGIDSEGERVDLTVPSGVVRVVKSFEVEADKETRIVLDFDLERSITCTGQGECHLRPVVGKTMVEVVPDEESGEDTEDVGETAPVA